MPFIAFLLVLLLPQQPGLPELEAGVSRTYSRLGNFSAEFEQIQQDASNQKRISRGHVYLKSGKKMLFEYTSPEKKSYYSDGKTYTTYTPALEQAIATPFGKADDERLSVFLIPWNPEWRGQFERIATPGGTDRPANPKNRLMELHPRKRDQLPVVLLEVDPASFLIQRFVLKYPDGGRSEFGFKNIQTVRLDDSLFRFVPPKGVVVEQDR